MYVKTDGIVLKETEYKDNDKLLTVLTRELGRVTVKARGIKSGKSGSKAACQLLAYSEFTLFEQQGRYTVREAVSKELFPELQKDLELLALASYFAQVTEVLSQEDYPTPELQSLLLNCLYALSDLGLSSDQVKAVFELRAACLSGYTPDLFGCHVCGSQTPDRFDLSSGLLECQGCRDASSTGIRLPVTPGILEAMRFICFCEPKKLFSFRLGQQQMCQLSELTEGFLTTQLERGFSALDYYKSICFHDQELEAT